MWPLYTSLSPRDRGQAKEMKYERDNNKTNIVYSIISKCSYRFVLVSPLYQAHALLMSIFFIYGPKHSYFTNTSERFDQILNPLDVLNLI